MAKVLVIGGNKGIGLELNRQYKARGEQVISTCRDDAGDLPQLDIEILQGIDVATQQGVEFLKDKLQGIQIDVLIHNAGILTNESLDDLDFERIYKQFEVNTVGPLRTIHALRNNLHSGSKIGILSSRMGSIEDNTSGGMYGYRISKAGVNILGVSLAKDLASDGIAVALLHPGMVATTMTNHRGISTKQSAQGLIQRMDELTLENSGKFWHAEGSILPW